jgi:L-threonylcarbamoyladenylate synthase
MVERPETVDWGDPGAEERIAATLSSGGVVAIPTETLYGLSCRGMSPDAVGRIARLKGIASPRGFVALASSIEMVELWVGRAPTGLDFLRAVWPAPLTAVLPVPRALPWGERRGKVETAAFRVPAHARLRSLVARLGEPLVSTSANRTGSRPLADARSIAREFVDGLDLVVTEAAGDRLAEQDRQPSTVADFGVWPPQVIRPGAFDLDQSLASWSDR